MWLTCCNLNIILNIRFCVLLFDILLNMLVSWIKLALHIHRDSWLWHIFISFKQISPLWPLWGLHMFKNLCWTRINNCHLSVCKVSCENVARSLCLHFGFHISNWIKVQFHSRFHTRLLKIILLCWYWLGKSISQYKHLDLHEKTKLR